jgi:hypothetical protein
MPGDSETPGEPAYISWSGLPGAAYSSVSFVHSIPWQPDYHLVPAPPTYGQATNGQSGSELGIGYRGSDGIAINGNSYISYSKLGDTRGPRIN